MSTVLATRAPIPAQARLFAPAAILSLLALTATSHATLVGLNAATTVNGDAELVFLAWDNNTDSPKVSFIKDLGVTMDDFFVRGQQDGGAQLFWYLGGTGTGTDGDAVWAQFLNTDVSPGVKVDPTKVRWAVFAFDGDQRDTTYVADDISLFTTLRQGTSGSATVISGLSEVGSGRLLDNVYPGMQSMVAGTNAQSGHADPGNGSAIVLQTAAPDWHFPFNTSSVPTIGRGGTSNLTYSDALAASAGNLLGQSSWFYKVSRGTDEFDQTLPVSLDEFDNLGGDGYWGLAAASDPARTGQYFLSYTIAAFATAREQSAGLLYANNFARLGGVLSLSSASGKGGSVLDLATSFVRGVAQARRGTNDAGDGRAFISAAPGLELGIDGDRALTAQLTTAVPEPSSWALFAAGLGWLGWRLSRRARA